MTVHNVNAVILSDNSINLPTEGHEFGRPYLIQGIPHAFLIYYHKITLVISIINRLLYLEEFHKKAAQRTSGQGNLRNFADTISDD